MGCHPNRCCVHVRVAGWSVLKKVPKNPNCSAGTDAGWDGKSAADGLGDGAHGVALVGDRLGDSASRSGLKGESKQSRGVEAMYGWPALCAVANVA